MYIHITHIMCIMYIHDRVWDRVWDMHGVSVLLLNYLKLELPRFELVS